MTTHVGILGGSFDPVHFGHLRIALEVSQKCHIPQIKFLPCKQQVLKTHRPIEASHRLAMLKLAIADQPVFDIDESEIQRETPSYMVDTLHSLKEEMPERILSLIMGADAARSLEQWYDWRAIFDLAHVIVVMRPHCDLTSISWIQTRSQPLHALKETSAGNVILLPTSLLEISAEEIRRQLAQGVSPKYLLPDAVLNYIYQHHLYERT